MNRHLLITILAAMPLCAGAVTPLWLRDAKISPDGNTIVFQYQGDLWLVPSAGGQATRLTATEDYEQTPVWSPDSRRIAYASNAHGNNDVFVIATDGSGRRRLTFNSASEIPEAFTPDGRHVMFSASIQDPAESALFPTGRMTELYQVDVDSPAAVEQVLATPARFISWAPDGKSFLYMDVKGFEDDWRKHHTSSVTRDIWRYTPKKDLHTNLTAHPGEDMWPVDAGKEFYFLSERDGGTMNVYRAPVADPSAAEAVTSFTTHPVRFLSRADNGTLAFAWDGELYTLAPGATQPTKVAIELIAPESNQVEKMRVTSGARQAKPSPDGKQVAFIHRGDVFVTSVEYKTTKQITSTPQAESCVGWLPDSRTLIFASEMDGPSNIYKATIARGDDEYDFANATLIDIEPLLAADGTERTWPRVSPDGKTLAFISDRNKLALMDMDTKQVRMLTDGSTNPREGNGFDYTWSPDSRWIALEITDRRHHPYSDVGIIDTKTGEIVNLTGTAYFDMQPRWALDGNAVVFASDRYGMRNHASWGSQNDVMMVFLNREAFDRYNLSKEELEILKDREKKDKDKDKDGDKEKDKGKDNDKDKSAKEIRVEKDGLQDRTIRLTPMSSDLSDFLLTSDGETLYYVTDAPEGEAQIWKVGLREPSFKLLTTRPTSGSFETTPDGKSAFYFGSSLAKFDPKNDKFTPINFSATRVLDHQAEREFMFDYVTREERERFYTPDMHGVDWPAMTEAYRRFLPHITNNHDFAELLSELLGELNVSHTGGRYYSPSDTQDDRTASLGLLYDLKYTGPGVRVAEVVTGGPFDRDSSQMKAGAVIRKINGEEITPESDLTRLLCDLAGQRTLVSFTVDGKNIDEVVKPISAGKYSSLLYDRWVKARAADVDRLSGGRLGYVHISSMDDESFRKAYSDMLGKYNDREGIVVDIRWNGGGRLHEDIEVLLSGHKYFTQVLRGNEICDMPSRRWNKPSIMVMSEACYSNAHGTPWVYRNRGLGKLVGAPVPGTMTSVNWVRLQDNSLVFGIPVVGYRLPDGSYLENSQLEPDILILNDPAKIVKGEDAQLRAAVEELLREIDGK